jgi:hypothetical protein
MNRKPNEEELKSYIHTWTDSRIRGVTEQAEGVLASFASSVVESATPQIREDAISGKIEADLAKFQRSQEGQWGRAVFYSVVANFLYTLFLILVVLVLAWNGVDLIGLLQKAKPQG